MSNILNFLIKKNKKSKKKNTKTLKSRHKNTKNYKLEEYLYNIMGGEIYIGKVKLLCSDDCNFIGSNSNTEIKSYYKNFRIFLKFANGIEDIVYEEIAFKNYYLDFCNQCYTEGIADFDDTFLIIICFGTYLFPILIFPDYYTCNICANKILNIYHEAIQIDKCQNLLIYENDNFSSYSNNISYYKYHEIMEEAMVRVTCPIFLKMK